MSSLTTLTRYGGWLPANPIIHKSFFQKHNKAILTPYRTKASHITSVDKFAAAIRADPEMVDLFNQIFLQVSSENQIADFDALLYMLDGVLVGPPKFHIARDEDGNEIGEPIGVPVYLLFDLLSNTGAGYDLFRKTAFNNALKDLLDTWGYSLTDQDEGWFSKIGIASLEAKNRGVFNETYVTPDPDAINRGYASWDAFFVREVQAHARPVHFPDNNTIIHSACESTVYRISTGIKEHDQFWLKGQAYSLYDLLNRNDFSVSFVGGTVYQAFLSPQDYHRWRSPVNGTIVHVELVPGTYYGVLPDEGAPEDDPDLQPGDPRGALIRSQAWLTMYATRALIWIQADNTDIGLMCFVGVGMAEVSTCEITVQNNDKVQIGTELGMFHFGGSSHALIFGPQTKVEFFDHVIIDTHLHVNSMIANVSRA